LGKSGAVIGIDLSENMLQHARKATSGPAGKQATVTFIGMPAEDLVFRDGTFDLVTHGQTLAYLVHPHRSLEEAHRVLKPGGRLAISAHRRSLNTEAQEIFFMRLKELARQHYLNVPRHRDDGRGSFGERHFLPGMLERHGFGQVRLTEMVTGGRAPTPRAWTELMAGAGPLPHTLLSVLGPRLRAQFEEDLEREMEQLGEDAFRYHHAFLFAVARRP
jgi:ubiquinone/menaquinone biosynthesis C-methylase UbiE